MQGQPVVGVAELVWPNGGSSDLAVEPGQVARIVPGLGQKDLGSSLCKRRASCKAILPPLRHPVQCISRIAMVCDCVLERLPFAKLN